MEVHARGVAVTVTSGGWAWNSSTLSNESLSLGVVGLDHSCLANHGDELALSLFQLVDPPDGECGPGSERRPDPRAQANEGAEEASDGHDAEENDHGGLASCP